MRLPTEINAAQVAYEAYCQHTGWKSLVSGQALPQWHNLKPEIQAAWKASADALVNLNRAVIGEMQQDALNLCYQIDKLPASPQQNTCSIEAWALCAKVNNLISIS